MLGTSLELQVLASSRADARRAVQAALAEIDRLERVFSRYDQESELNRWLNDARLEPSAELADLLRRAEAWRTFTGNAFHPGSEALTLLWRQAERDGRLPSESAVSRVLGHLHAPVWDERPGWRPEVPLNLNAFAKGFIVDRAAQVACDCGAAAVLVNLGGDLRHLGTTDVPVDVMNPFAPYDNAAPLVRVPLRQQGLATSGGAFRGFKVGPDQFSHLLDPRTGYPVDQVVGASVLAATCADADVLATAFSVFRPAESLALSAQLPGVSCLLVSQDGKVQRGPGFPNGLPL
ncbi:FAD:protein FMN transferase [Deinococcus altitudinis]|uniref:FAD:protein FMN transferase n=1 Tax=Deinococcus altitudinis TaxID=468914 RepID=UPI003891BB8E